MERRVTSSMECATPSPKPKGLLGNRIRGVATQISGRSDGEIEDAHNRMRWRRRGGGGSGGGGGGGEEGEEVAEERRPRRQREVDNRRDRTLALELSFFKCF
jgi:hypothetical protein